jgi:hypothetical protein
MPVARLVAVSIHLTKREVDVMNLLSRGFSNAEIGVSLKIGTNTVKHYLNSAQAKLLPANSDKINSRVAMACFWNCELFRIGAGIVIPDNGRRGAARLRLRGYFRSPDTGSASGPIITKLS